MSTAEEAWRDRVLNYILTHGNQGWCEAGLIGQKVRPPPGVRVVRGLEDDPRFRVERVSGMIRLHVREGVPNPAPQPQQRTPRKRKTTAPKSEAPKKKAKLPPRFQPTKTDFCPPSACWEVVLGTTHASPGLWPSWRWARTLSCVSKAFADALRPLRTAFVRTVAAAHGDELSLYKSQANRLFGLPLKLLATLPFQCRTVRGWHYHYEMHYMRPDAVLALAFAHHGASFEAINAAFVRRAERLERLRAKRKVTIPTATTKAASASDSDE